MKKINNKRGITLIALVITIIILLILVAVAIRTLGANGILDKANWSAYVTEYETVDEAKELYVMENQLKEYGETNTSIDNLYPIDSNSKIKKEELSESLKSTIMFLENVNEEEFDKKVDLYKVDFNKIQVEAKKEYVINKISGKLYSIQYQKYAGNLYHTPELGIKKNGEIVEEVKTKLTIHYLPGYDSATEYIQEVDIDAKNVILENLDNIGFNNNGNTFVNWKDVTLYHIDKNMLLDEDAEDEDSTETIEETEESITYENGEEITLEGVDIYLEAQWSSYNVTLHCNGGNINGQETLTYAVLDGQPYGDLPDPVKDGYVFGGWHKNSEDFSNENQIVGDDIYVANDEQNTVSDLYAYWTDVNIATITYNVDSSLGETCQKTSKKVVIGKKIGSLPTSKHTKKENENGKYNFDCWTTTKGDKVTKITKGTVVQGNMNLYALYTIHINFDYQGGTVNKRYRKTKRAYKNVKIGGRRGYLYTYAQKSGVKGNGWWTQPDGNGIKMTYKTKITQTQDFTLYKDWLDPYIVTYNLNYDTAEEPPISQYKSPKKSIKLSKIIPKRSGYLFVGWSKDGTENGTIYKPGEKYLEDQDITLYAIWRSGYSIIYDANEGTGAPEEQTKEPGVDIQISSIAPVREGYTFLGWSEYSDSDSYKFLAGETYTEDKGIKLYAVWSDSSEIKDTITGDSILSIVENKALENGNYNFIVNEETYRVNVRIEEGNTVYSEKDEKPVIGDGIADNAMAIVKCTGNLTINQGVIATPFARAKGMLIYTKGTLTNNGTISMTARGASAEGQNVYLWKNKSQTYEYVPANGADVGVYGGESSRAKNAGNNHINVLGKKGMDGTLRSSGGGGSGGAKSYAAVATSGAGSSGTSYSGGTGGGGVKVCNSSATSTGGSPNGGAGGNAKVTLGTSYSNSYAAGGGAGNPGGKKHSPRGTSTNGTDGTGGLLIIYAHSLENNYEILSNGSLGGTSNGQAGGGSSGGGSINIFYKSKLLNYGIIQSNGGESVSNGGAGGAGTISTGSVATGTYIADE